MGHDSLTPADPGVDLTLISNQAGLFEGNFFGGEEGAGSICFPSFIFQEKLTPICIFLVFWFQQEFFKQFLVNSGGEKLLTWKKFSYFVMKICCPVYIVFSFDS